MPIGAGPAMLSDSTLPVFLSYTVMKPLPPNPELCGSTRFSVAATATAASNALPPFISTSMPAIDASGWADVTRARLPGTAGRCARRLARGS